MPNNAVTDVTVTNIHTGLKLDVLKGRYASTNNGLSDRYHTLILGGEHPESVRLVCRWAGTPREYWHAEPVTQPEGTLSPMFGGNYVALPREVGHAIGRNGAIPLHDRFETPEQYNHLSQ